MKERGWSKDNEGERTIYRHELLTSKLAFTFGCLLSLSVIGDESKSEVSLLRLSQAN
jgi:hypothetical protein